MKESQTLMVVGLALILVATAAIAGEKGSESTASRVDVLYTCSCPADCSCTSASSKPGKCECGKDLAWSHVLKVEGSDAYVCACQKDCTCKLDSKDSSKCGCGNELKKVSLKGSGLYTCNCGPTCTCNTMSAKPGKCGCGKELVKVD